MAITTLDGALAGMQPPRFIAKATSPVLNLNRFHSFWYTAGSPGPGTADTSTATGVVRSSSSALVVGQIPHTDPAGGKNSYLTRFVASPNQPGTLYLCDRLWDCGANTAGGAISPTSTGVQTISSATWPARDVAGATAGDGVLIGLEVSTVLGSGIPTFTLTYTNQSGTGSKTAGLRSGAITTTAAAGAFYDFQLAAGDTGVQSVQSIQASATQTSGQWVLVAYRVLASLDIMTASVPNDIDLLTGGFPQLYNGVVPFMLWGPSATGAVTLNGGTYAETQG